MMRSKVPMTIILFIVVWAAIDLLQIAEGWIIDIRLDGGFGTPLRFRIYGLAWGLLSSFVVIALLAVGLGLRSRLAWWIALIYSIGQLVLGGAGFALNWLPMPDNIHIFGPGFYFVVLPVVGGLIATPLLLSRSAREWSLGSARS